MEPEPWGPAERGELPEPVDEALGGTVPFGRLEEGGAQPGGVVEDLVEAHGREREVERRRPRRADQGRTVEVELAETAPDDGGPVDPVGDDRGVAPSRAAWTNSPSVATAVDPRPRRRGCRERRRRRRHGDAGSAAPSDRAAGRLTFPLRRRAVRRGAAPCGGCSREGGFGVADRGDRAADPRAEVVEAVDVPVGGTRSPRVGRRRDQRVEVLRTSSWNDRSITRCRRAPAMRSTRAASAGIASPGITAKCASAWDMSRASSIVAAAARARGIRADRRRPPRCGGRAPWRPVSRAAAAPARTPPRCRTRPSCRPTRPRPWRSRAPTPAPVHVASSTPDAPRARP